MNKSESLEEVHCHFSFALDLLHASSFSLPLSA